jgi:hypothetical protein
MRIAKIISDGTANGTRILDEKGDAITNVVAANWSVDATGSKECIVTLFCLGVEVDIMGKVEESHE